LKLYLLPYARFTMISPKSRDAVALLLLRAVPMEGKSKRRENNLTEYFGSVSQTDFLLERNLNFNDPVYTWLVRRNPFVPIFHGKIKPFEENTKITVTAIFGPLVTIFLLICYGFLIPATLFYFYDVISTRRLELKDFSFVFFSIGILYLCFIVSFNLEVMQTKEFLQRTIRAKEVT
jgi:hypothetical protein